MSNPKRTQTITQKIPGKVTGLKAAVFVHVDFVEHEGVREITTIRASEKGKDGSTLDNILGAVSDALTAIVRQDINRNNIVQLPESKKP